jgi:Co/Zn/Cd efflux system component/copper chaperone CopZ
MSGATRTVFLIPGMDCPAEENVVRLALDEVPGVSDVGVDLATRRVTVVHVGPVEPIGTALTGLGMRARIDDAPPGPIDDHADRSVLIAILAINAAMFVVELGAGLWAHSVALIADSLDMLFDAVVYGVALAAVGGAAAARRRSARLSGWLQLVLAGLILLEALRRALTGSEPVPMVMIGMGAVALLANAVAVVLLAGRRDDGLHMRASWIFTRNDTLGNAGVIAAGVLVAVTGSAWPDLTMGVVIAAIIASGAWRILRISR